MMRSRDFRRKLARHERTLIRVGVSEEMAELRDELIYEYIDLSDPYIRDLIGSIPGLLSTRFTELVG